LETEFGGLLLEVGDAAGLSGRGLFEGFRLAGGVVAGVNERGWRGAGVSGLSEPDYNGGRAPRVAGDNWEKLTCPFIL